MPVRFSRLVFALGLVLLGAALRAEGLLVAYVDNASGGVVRIDLDADGQPVAATPAVVFESPDFPAAHKLRVSPDGRVAALAAEIEDGPNFALIDLAAPATVAPRLLTLGYAPEEHRFAAGRLYVGGSGGHLQSLDPTTGRILRRWNSRRDLRPAGHKPEDFHSFLRTISVWLEKYPVDLFALCLMRNHWHLVLRPRTDGGMGKLCGWISSTHTLRYHAHNDTRGFGHLYQGPFKSFPVQDDNHFLTVCRYVERNALRAKFVKRAEDWEFGSLYRWHHKCDREPALLSSWPIRRPSGWKDRVNKPLTQAELDAIGASCRSHCDCSQGSANGAAGRSHWPCGQRCDYQ
jgi:putative transposase